MNATIETSSDEVGLPSEKRARMDFSASVRVLVGPDKKAFIVHEPILTAHSRFFRAACSARWKQVNADVELPSDSTETFNDYLAWIYDQDSPADEEPETSTEMINTYVLADKLGDWNTANQIASWMLLMTKGKRWILPTLENIELCYSHTMDGAPLRRMLVDIWVAAIGKRDPSAFLQQSGLPADFLRDVAILFAKLSYHNKEERAAYAVFRHNMHSHRCQYHLHDAENLPIPGQCTSHPEEESEVKT